MYGNPSYTIGVTSGQCNWVAIGVRHNFTILERLPKWWHFKLESCHTLTLQFMDPRSHLIADLISFFCDSYVRKLIFDSDGFKLSQK